MDFLADGFGDELGGDALVPGFDDLPTTLAAVDVTLEPVDTKLDSEEQKETSSAETGQEESEFIFKVKLLNLHSPCALIQYS